MNAILAPVRLFGSEHAQENPVRSSINGKRNLLALDCRPIKVGMIALEFGINQFARTLSGDGIIIVLLPDAIVRTRNVKPKLSTASSVKASSKPPPPEARFNSTASIFSNPFGARRHTMESAPPR